MKYYVVIVLAMLGLVMEGKTPPNQQSAVLKVLVKNFKNNKGNLVVAVFDNKMNFLEKDFKSKIVKVGDTKELVVVFQGLPYGEYAISVFHDENENKKLDTNFVGIPKESYGFSNNAKGTFGPPAFKDAKFSYTQSEQVIEIGL